MARPKKDPDVPAARERIIEAFWKLLEGNPLDKISVKMLIAEAGCNRGTFYYHFQDTSDLLRQAVTSELVENGRVPRVIFNVLANPALKWEDVNIDREGIGRISLAIRNGGADLVQDIVFSTVLSMWSMAFGKSSDDLAPSTITSLRFMAHGMLGVICNDASVVSEEEWSSRFPIQMLGQVERLVITSMCETEGVSPSDVTARLMMLAALPDGARGSVARR